jgi:DNA-binding PadR family transcriptional regulator
MDTISNREAALLGLVSEKPKHAYEIENDIQERDMRYWTEISMSSVYKLLNKLESRELLESQVKLSKNNVAQKIYSITEKGKKALREKLRELISAWQPCIHPVDIGLANLFLLNKREAIEGLDSYSESLDKMIQCYIELEKFLVDGNCPPGNIQLATRRIHLLRAEKEWLRTFIEDYENE